MTNLLLLAGLLLSAAPSSADSAASPPGDAPLLAPTEEQKPVLTDADASKLLELRRRSQVLLDERPGAGRFVGAGLLITLGIPTALAGVIGVLLPLGNNGGFITFGAGWALAGLLVLGLGVGLISWGIWLAATGSRERDAIDEERTKLDARIEKLERKRRQPAAPPAAEVGFPGQSGAVLARF